MPPLPQSQHIPEREKNKAKQNYLCKEYGRQFISDHERTYKGTLSWVKDMIKIMTVGGVGIRDIGIILQISITTVLKVLKSTKYKIKPKQSRYDCLEINEFWTHVGKKKNKVWLIYAYHRGERGNRSICMGEEGTKDGEKAEEKDKAAWDKL